MELDEKNVEKLEKILKKAEEEISREEKKEKPSEKPSEKEEKEESKAKREWIEVRESIIFEKDTLENTIAKLDEQISFNKKYLDVKKLQEKFLSVGFFHELRGERKSLENQINSLSSQANSLRKSLLMVKARLEYLSKVEPE